MATNIVRMGRDERDFVWGEVVGEQIYILESRATTLGDLLRERAAKGLSRSGADPVSLPEAELLSPVTEPCRLVCQGLNYSDHVRETGGDPAKIAFNLIFRKSSSSLTGPYHDILRPDFVSLLDYEVELGVIIGREIDRPVQVTAANLGEYVAGIVLTNDVSARDIQAPQGQWYKGKSYPTFGPTGPMLCLFDPDEIAMIDDLELELTVNGETRQRSNTRNLIYKPAETLSEVSTFMKLSPGDMLLTGTPGGVAVKAPPKIVRKLAQLFLDETSLMRVFVKGQRKNPAYLKDGDVVEARIYSRDGKIDLGRQRNVVKAAAEAG